MQATPATPATSLWEGLGPDEGGALEALVHPDPHHVLGAHPAGRDAIVRALRPGATSVRCVPEDPAIPPADMTAMAPWGLWGVRLANRKAPLRYRIEARYPGGVTHTERDAYAFPPIIGPLDEHLVSEGQHRRIYEKFGAHPRVHEGVEGVSFAVWAPNAKRVSVVGEWNGWDGRAHPMRRIGATGIWELFIPGLRPGQCYKYELRAADGSLALKFDPFAFASQLRPETASVVARELGHVWNDDEWMEVRATRDVLRRPMSVYEVHLGSWTRVPEEGNRWMTYRELAPRLAEHVRAAGFTHVELLPVAEHPFDASWGYQVTGYFAPTSRFGSPDDFRFFVDHLHQQGIGVILDWVPAHFPRDTFALARFDGTALYEHEDPRQGAHPDWGTLIFNYGRNEVRNFLVANALFWLDRYHVDGLRVDAVAAMLYLDYSRRHDEWVPNEHGGRENLAAIAFLQDLNRAVHGEFPGAMVIAEESTAWPGVSRPTYLGGLGFTFKWNMGWMHDTLKYFATDPVYRRFHHNQLTFGFLYAWSENYVLALSHDEVVHLKGSLLAKMAGDAWQKFANLRALYGWMWCHPGKKLLFMGAEFGQGREWNHDTGLDWHQLELPQHAGVLRLVGDLNRFYQSRPALWEADVDPEGFRWIDANDTEASVATFLRYDRSRQRFVVCVLNATPVARHGYRVGVPRGGAYREAINTDAEVYGGGNVGNAGRVHAQDVPWHGHPQSLELVLPPLSVLILEPEA